MVKRSEGGERKEFNPFASLRSCEGVSFMSREEAVAIYIDNLLGFHGTFAEYCQALDTLSENDKIRLCNAVRARLKDDVGISCRLCRAWRSH
jgi:hypothetical protein